MLHFLYKRECEIEFPKYYLKEEEISEREKGEKEKVRARHWNAGKREVRSEGSRNEQKPFKFIVL